MRSTSCSRTTWLQQLVTGRLKIGVTPAGHCSPENTITDIATEYQGIAIETVSGSADQLCPMLVHGEVNLVVGMTSTLSRWKNYKSNNGSACCDISAKKSSSDITRKSF